MTKQRVAVLYEVWWEDERIPPRPPGIILSDPHAQERGDDSGDAHEAVYRALARLGYRPHYAVLEGDRPSLERLLRTRTSLVFNLTESYAGDDTMDFHVAGLLELMGKPFTGSDARALHLGQDKALAKTVLLRHGVPTPEFTTVARGDRLGALPAEFPLIVKPSREDGSIGIDTGSVVHDRRALKRRIDYVHECFRGPALIERYVEGREIYVSIVGNDAPEALPLVEIDLRGVPDGVPRIAGTEVKWWTGTPIHRDTPPVYPRGIAARTTKRTQQIALAAYRAIGLRDYGRVDMRLAEDGTPYVIEVNPNPWLHPECELTMAWTKTGRGYDELVDRIVSLALERSTRGSVSYTHLRAHETKTRISGCVLMV